MIDFAELPVKHRITQITRAYRRWIPRETRLLDVGCGNGIVTAGIAGAFSSPVTGCDIERYLARDIPYVHMKTPDRLPFPDGSVAIVMFNDVLHHTNKHIQKSLLAEAVRVATDSILIFELLPTPLVYVADFLVNKIYHPTMNVPLTFRTPEDWRHLFSEYSVRVTTHHVPRPIFSPFPHVAFRLQKHTNTSYRPVSYS